MFLIPRPFVVTVAAGALVFAACGTGTDTPAGDSTAASATESTIGSFNEADIAFAQGMIPHHRQAVAMAEIALAFESGARTEIRELSRQIKDAQDPEIELLTNLLDTWGVEPMADHSGTMDDMESMDGMMTPEEMTALADLTGANFDTAWAKAMIAHHEGAISMAETVKASGTNPELVDLANSIISSQQAEIAQMTALLGG